MRTEVDCVVVTDHNSGEWVDRLKEELGRMEEDGAPGFRRLCLLPGAEITVTGGVHVLAVMPKWATGHDIGRLLGAVGYGGTPGASDGIATSSVNVVAEVIQKHGGIAIAAHIEQPCGLLAETSGNTLKAALSSDALSAVEVVDPSMLGAGPYADYRLRRPEVLGSDSHHPTGSTGQAFPGSRFTWVKMSTPSFQGIRLALVDQSDSLIRSDEALGDPNGYAALHVESIEVRDAQYLGRGQPFRLRFNPWLNVVIGGRGSGKSTVVEFLRLGLGREDQVPSQLSSEVSGYARVNSGKEDGLLTPRTRIGVQVVKDKVRYRMTLAVDAERSDPPHELQFEVQNTDGSWEAARGRPVELLPVGLYSQKQVFEMARDPLSLLKIVDSAPEVADLQYAQKSREIETKYLASRARIRALNERLTVEESLHGEIEEISRQLKLLEGAAYAEALHAHEAVQHEARLVEAWELTWRGVERRIRELGQSIEAKELSLPASDGSEDGEYDIVRVAKEVQAEYESIAEEFEGLARRAERVEQAYDEAKQSTKWFERRGASERAYLETVEKLKKEGVDDPEQFGRSVQQRQDLQRQLSDLDATREEITLQEKEAEGHLSELLSIRKELSERRTTFLARVLDGNQFVRISVRPFGATESVQQAVRQLLQREEGFDGDIGVPGSGVGLIGDLPVNESNTGDLEKALQAMKRKARAIADGDFAEESLRDKRFGSFMKRLQPEVLDRIDTWFPEDGVHVEYSPGGDGHGFTTLRTASPGQKTAALLAFLLSYGDEPIILDQPEDDLDNALIYELIVRQLKKQKKRRQLIVVTHNPNIVVNGDAEFVAAMEARGGQSYVNVSGGLQEPDVRDMICRIMEGGKKAFDTRYRRIFA
ncbi:MAG: AAA family ATPase [Trueperaceae bacterium]